MKRLCASVLAGFIGIVPAIAKDRHCMFRVHVQANQRDTATFATSVPAKLSGKNVAIERVARISERDVVAFYPYLAPDRTYGALFQLDEHGRVMLESLSVEHRGEILFIFINGRPATEMEIDRRVSDGKIYIASGLNAADVAAMKRDWRLIKEQKR